MNADTVINLGQQALYITALISAPILLSVLVIGLLVGMFQAATQINEQTLSFIPKLLVLAVVLAIAGPWMLEVMTSFITRMFNDIPSLIG